MRNSDGGRQAVGDSRSSPVLRVLAPGNESGLLPPALVAVDAEEGDEVRWIWTFLADGRRVVTGCKVVSNDAATSHLPIR